METLNALGRLNQVPLDMTLEGLRSVGQTQQADQIGLQEMLRKQQFEQQADPMRLQQMGTENDRGLQALAKAKRENVEADYTSKARMDAELHKAFAESSGADIKRAMDRFQQMAMDPNPQIRKIGITGLQSSKDWLMKKEENDRHLEGIRLQGQAQRDVARINAAAKTDVASMKGSGAKSMSVDDAVKAGKMTYEKAAVAFQNMADNEEDPVKKQEYELRAARYELAELKKRQAGGQATPKVDTGAVTGLPTTGGAPPTPALGGGAAPAPKPAGKLSGPAAEDWISRAMKANPGMTRQQIEEQGRAKGKL